MKALKNFLLESYGFKYSTISKIKLNNTDTLEVSVLKCKADEPYDEDEIEQGQPGYFANEWVFLTLTTDDDGDVFEIEAGNIKSNIANFIKKLQNVSGSSFAQWGSEYDDESYIDFYQNYVAGYCEGDENQSNWDANFTKQLIKILSKIK